MQILFITRKYPPAVGGMEKVSYVLGKELSRRHNISLVAWGGSQKWLIWFLPKAFVQALWTTWRRPISVVHLGDGLLAPIGLVLKVLTGRRVTVTVHGLDVTFKNRLYQVVVPFCLKRLDAVICVSSATREECLKRGVSADKCTVVTWGIYPDEYFAATSRQRLQAVSPLDISDRKVLFTSGRLVKRKGVAWFVEHVMPQLGEEYVYLIAGAGPEREAIAEAIKRNGLEDKVALLGRVSEADKKTLLNSADVFVMPNIIVPGDMEGFGMVAVEAASAGLPVVAPYIEGIRDAMVDGMGYFVEEVNASAWKQTIAKARRLSRRQVRQVTNEHYSWSLVADRYSQALQ